MSKNPVFKLPLILFKDEKYRQLSHTALIAYSVYVALHEEAVANQQIDETGLAYVVCKNSDLAQFLNVSNETIIKVKKELIEADLMRQLQRGFGQPNMLFIVQ